MMMGRRKSAPGHDNLNRSRPPRLAVAFLSAVLPHDDSDSILGDLSEVYPDRHRTNRLAAYLWFWGQVVLFSTAFVFDGIRRPTRRHSIDSGTTFQTGSNWSMYDFVTHFRQTVRSLGRDPRYAIRVVFILAIGIGPAAAMVSVVQTVLIQPLDFNEPDRLGLIRIDLGEVKGHAGLSLAEVIDLRKLEKVFSTVDSTSRQYETSLGEENDRMVSVPAANASTGLFDMLGVSPILGRNFDDDDEKEVPAIISFDLWQGHFGGDPNIIEKPVLLDGNPTPVIGVLPQNFALRLGTGAQISSTIDVWRPLPITDHRNFWGFPSIARLKDGVSFEQADLALESLVSGLVDQYPDTYGGASLGLRVHPLLPDLVRESRPAIRAALAGVILLLVVAITNATALVIARLKTRESEFAIRSAIGARWGALVRDVFAESVMLTLMGAAVGGGIAAAAIAGLKAFIPKTVPRWDAIAVGWDLIAYTALLALVSLLSAGLIPAVKAGRSRAWTVIGGNSQQRGSRRASTRFVLVGTQLAMAVVLTFGAVQLARSATHLVETELGFSSERILAFKVPLDSQRYPSRKEKAQFYRQLREQLEAIPGVQSVGAVSHLPLSGTGPIDAYTPDVAGGLAYDQPMANHFGMLPGYFETIGVDLVRGRFFTDVEHESMGEVIVVDENLANLTWPGSDPIGKKLKLGWGLPDSTVVGVVRHPRVIDVRSEVRPQIYAPFSLVSFWPLHFTLRTEGDPTVLIGAVRESVADLGSGRAVSGFGLLSDNVASATSTLRFVTGLVAVLAISAALLSALGLYAVVSFVVHQHRRATAIRSALGATPQAWFVITSETEGPSSWSRYPWVWLCRCFRRDSSAPSFMGSMSMTRRAWRSRP
jgi:predicted permease